MLPRIERFDPEIHDRSSFSCGVAAVDNFLKLTANKLDKADNLRAFVMTSPAREFIGLYALNVDSIDYENLPRKYARTRPGHGRIPVVFISRMGVDSRFAGRGCGRDLMADALKRVASASDDLGIAMVVLDVLDCGNPGRTNHREAFYRSFGFERLATYPRRTYLPVQTIRSVAD